MKKSSIAIFVFVLASVLLLCACSHKNTELSDDEAMAKLADYTTDNSVDVVSYLSDQGYSLSSSVDLCYVFRSKTGTVVIEETGAPAYDIYVGDGNGNNRQYGYPAADRVDTDGEIHYETYRATIGGRTTNLPTSVYAEVVRLVERQKGGK